MTITPKRCLHAANYREQPDLTCCRNCRHSRPANMTWSRVWCSRTSNNDTVSDTGICDEFELLR